MGRPGMVQLSKKERKKLRPLMEALRFVESSAMPTEEVPDGDEGTSIGPFQISHGYHEDAWDRAKRAYKNKGKQHQPDWDKCRDLTYAEDTVLSYWMRYCPEAVKAGDFEVLAKTHNGGPSATKKESVNYYWGKVANFLENPTMPYHEQLALERRKEQREALFATTINVTGFAITTTAAFFGTKLLINAVRDRINRRPGV
eukprot:jgi/Chlat1/9281/Chrsp99S08543